MKLFLSSITVVLLNLACCNPKNHSNSIIKKDSKGGISVNFVDSKRPDVLMQKDGTSLTGLDDYLLVQHSNGGFSGMLVQKSNRKVRYVVDNSGDGLPDFITLDTKERWEIVWKIDGNDPKVELKRVESAAIK